MSEELPNIETYDDIVDLALREMVRTGKVTRVKDKDGRDVFKPVPPN